ncbi:MAG: ADP-ribosylglycohydrolase family protein [Acidimicrobiia bacterium]|nr:ADP-ribosylglycohydrolase family protein [Acidimicrobiia bacterium]
MTVVPTELTNRYRGAMVGVAIGDALGARFEGHPGPVDPGTVAAHLGDTSPLTYTDDTALTIAVAESLLACGRLDDDHLAHELAATYSREPHRGYGAGTAALLGQVAAGGDWRRLAAAQFDGTGSFGNGAAMRSTPLALHAGSRPVLAADLARRAARTTHTHPAGAEGAAAISAAISHTLCGARPGTLPHIVQLIVREPHLADQLWAVADLPAHADPQVVAGTTGTGISALEAVPAAIASHTQNPDSFTDTIAFAISLGGDTDSIAAMAGALAGACHGYGAIPHAWIDRVEGCERLLQLADRLAARHTDRGV